MEPCRQSISSANSLQELALDCLEEELEEEEVPAEVGAVVESCLQELALSDTAEFPADLLAESGLMRLPRWIQPCVRPCRCRPSHACVHVAADMAGIAAGIKTRRN